MRFSSGVTWKCFYFIKHMREGFFAFTKWAEEEKALRWRFRERRALAAWWGRRREPRGAQCWRSRASSVSVGREDATRAEGQAESGQRWRRPSARPASPAPLWQLLGSALAWSLTPRNRRGSPGEARGRRSGRSVHGPPPAPRSSSLILLRVFTPRTLVRPSPGRHGPAELESRHIVSSNQEFNIEWESVFVPVYWRRASGSLRLVQTSACGQRRGLRMEYASRPAVCCSGLLPPPMLCGDCPPPDLVFYIPIY